MLKIKLDIEGESEDIEQLFAIVNSKTNLNKLINSPRKKNDFHWLWILAIVVIFFALNFCSFIKIFEGNWKSGVVLGTFFIFAILVVLLHIKINNLVITIMCALFGLSIMLMGLGAISPEKAIDFLQNKIPTIEKAK